MNLNEELTQRDTEKTLRFTEFCFRIRPNILKHRELAPLQGGWGANYEANRILFQAGWGENYRNIFLICLGFPSFSAGLILSNLQIRLYISTL